MFFELRKDFDGISKEVLTVFVKCYVTCELSRGKVKRGVVVKPILSDDQNSEDNVTLTGTSMEANDSNSVEAADIRVPVLALFLPFIGFRLGEFELTIFGCKNISGTPFVGL